MKRFRKIIVDNAANEWFFRYYVYDYRKKLCKTYIIKNEKAEIYRARTKATLLFLRLSVLVGRSNMGELSQGQFQTTTRE